MPEHRICNDTAPTDADWCVLPPGHKIRHAGPRWGTSPYRQRWGGGEEYPGDVDEHLPDEADATT